MSEVESDGEIDLLEGVSQMIKTVEEYVDRKVKESVANAEACMGDLRRRISILENENKTLKKTVSDLSKDNITENRTCQCQGLFKCIMEAGQTFLSGEAGLGVGNYIVTAHEGNKLFVTPLDNRTSDTVDITQASNQLYATPIDTGRTDAVDLITNTEDQMISYSEQSDSIQGTANFNPLMNSSSYANEESSNQISAFTPLMRGQAVSATSLIYTSAEELPEELRKKVQAFHMERSSHCNNDKMSDLQRAYLKYKMSEYEYIDRAGKRGSVILRDGVSDRIWPGDASWSKYVRTRIKNEMNVKKLTDMRAVQAKRMKKRRLNCKLGQTHEKDRLWDRTSCKPTLKGVDLTEDTCKPTLKGVDLTEDTCKPTLKSVDNQSHD